MTALVDAEGRVTRWPRKSAERDYVLSYLIEKFTAGQEYQEVEVNAILKRFHTFGDWALLRRELYESRRLDRDPRSGVYWRMKK